MTRMRNEEERPTLASGNRPRIQPTHQRSSPSQERSLTLSSPREQRGTWHHHRRKLQGHHPAPRCDHPAAWEAGSLGHSHIQQPRAASTRGPGGHSKPLPHGNATHNTACLLLGALQQELNKHAGQQAGEKFHEGESIINTDHSTTKQNR